MNKQLSFNMPVVDGTKTKKEVEEVFETYRQYLAMMPSDILPKVTPSYSIIPPTVTNEFNSSTENIAIERIEYEQERNKFMSWVCEGVNRLKDDERKIIIQCFMDDAPGYDPDIWLEIGVGKTKYYKLKGQALLRLAFNLKIEVYKKNYKQKEVKSA
ncbi:ArpU family transcriptional regulator [Bacillus pseudomycoides]|nr:ArpU family transcriptional regulator [Bacillus pseudomycoides]